MQGTIKFFREDKGFGFILDESEKDVFFHRTGLAHEDYEPRQGDRVTFQMTEGKKGPAATNVKLGE